MNPREIIAYAIILFLTVFYIVNTERIINQQEEIKVLKQQTKTRIFINLK